MYELQPTHQHQVSLGVVLHSLVTSCNSTPLKASIDSKPYFQRKRLYREVDIAPKRLESFNTTDGMRKTAMACNKLQLTYKSDRQIGKIQHSFRGMYIHQFSFQVGPCETAFHEVYAAAKTQLPSHAGNSIPHCGYVSVTDAVMN
jgi:hypothetical protein